MGQAFVQVNAFTDRPGSAHCALDPFWAPRLGKEDLAGYQASARGGTVRVAPRGKRVLLSGQAVTVLRGELAP